MSKLSNRVYNFSAGPAALPDEVMQQAQQEFLNYNGMGVSVMEISHRGSEFIAIAEQAEKDLRDLLSVPTNYKVLFLHGGAQGQFAAVPMNLLGGHNKKVDYIYTGVWSKLAIAEAKKYAEVNVAASSETQGFTTIPDFAEWKVTPGAAYLHYCDNETVNGVEFDYVPAISSDTPLVVDVSSNVLSKPLDVSKFGVIYGGAQKNIGPAGMAIVIVRDDLLHQAMPITPSIWNYAEQAEKGSMRNTPPTFVWYMAGLGFQWLKQQGGVTAMANINARKAKKLYAFIDRYPDFYQNKIVPRYRSRMNVVFHLPTEELNQQFCAEAKKAGLFGLKGHYTVGGIRASIYNAISEDAVDALLDFMEVFVKKFRK